MADKCVLIHDKYTVNGHTYYPQDVVVPAADADALVKAGVAEYIEAPKEEKKTAGGNSSAGGGN